MDRQVIDGRKQASALLLVLFLSLGGSEPCRAQGNDRQDSDPVSTHWAFSAFFGTGWYDISDSESVFIIRAPLSRTWRDSSFANGDRVPGVEFHFPVTLGLHNISELDEVTKLDNFGTVAFTPGIELEIPVSNRWYLRPMLHAGWGKETDGGDDAWMYYGGIKSRFTPGGSGLDWSLLNSLFHAAYKAKRGDSGSVSTAMVGAEFRHPLSQRLAKRQDMQFNWHLTYTWLFDQAEFEVRNGSDQAVRDQWELGIALAPRLGSFRLGWFSVDQLGLSLKASSDGNYRAISFNFSSVFLR